MNYHINTNIRNGYTNALAGSASEPIMPKIAFGTPMGSPIATDYGSNTLTNLNSPVGSGAQVAKSKSPKKKKTPSKEEKFNKLVDIITLSSRSKGQLIEEVSKGWKDLSKF